MKLSSQAAACRQRLTWHRYAGSSLGPLAYEYWKLTQVGDADNPQRATWPRLWSGPMIERTNSPLARV